MQSRLLSALALTASFGLGLLATPASAQYDTRYRDDYDTRYASDYGDPPERVGRLSYVTGEVSFAPAAEREWYRAVPNRPLVRGDRLYTDRTGLAEIQLGDAAVRIDRDSAVELLTLDDSYAQIELSEGSLNLFVRRLYEGEVYEIATPMLALVVTQPGSYRIDVDPRSGFTDVLVWDGAADAYGTRANFPLREGEAVRFHDPELRDYEVYRLPRPDAFDQFAFERDERMRRSESLRYLPAGVIGYDDLDRHGQWSTVSSYGRVWFPRTVSRGWAPYRNGHWIWQDPWGWTWVDDSPWGFAPFHYGRWVHVNQRWGWVPGPTRVRAVYAPALVAFVGGSNWSLSVRTGSSPIGWFPLGPREVYVPPYHASRDYFRRVNVTNTVINTTQITNVYNNYYLGDSRGNMSRLDYRYRSLPTAVTAVPSDVFARARPVQQAMINVDARSTARAEVRRFAAVAPTSNSLVGPVQRATARPSRAVFERNVVARRTPAPAPVPFAARAEHLQRNPGQPLALQQLQQLRERGQLEAPQRRVRVVESQPQQRVDRSQARAVARDAELPRGRGRAASPAVREAVEQRRERSEAEAQARERGRSAAVPARAREPAVSADPVTRARQQQVEQDARGRVRSNAARSQIESRRQEAEAEAIARDEAREARERARRGAAARDDEARRQQARGAAQAAEARREEVERGAVADRAEQARRQQVERRAAAARADEARREQAERSAVADRAEQARRQQVERRAAAARADEARRQQAERSAIADRAEQARRQQIERRAEDARRQQAERTAAAGRAEQARRQQAERSAAAARADEARRQREAVVRQHEERSRAVAVPRERVRAEAVERAERAQQAAQARRGARADRSEDVRAAIAEERAEALEERGRGRGRGRDDDDERRRRH